MNFIAKTVNAEIDAHNDGPMTASLIAQRCLARLPASLTDDPELTKDAVRILTNTAAVELARRFDPIWQLVSDFLQAAEMPVEEAADMLLKRGREDFAHARKLETYKMMKFGANDGAPTD